LIACWQASCSPAAGTFWPLSAGVSWGMSWSVMTVSFDWMSSGSFVFSPSF